MSIAMKYQDAIKSHLASYKRSHLGINQNGIWKKNNQCYEHILPESLRKLNILETYRDELWQFLKNTGSIKLHKDFHHLNSSQAMAFNLFYPFIHDNMRLLPIMTESLGLPPGEAIEASRPSCHPERSQSPV